MKTLRIESRDEWRAWLAKHHDRETEIWLVSFKAHTGKSNAPYEECVEEALCFGWIDSLIKRLDEDRFAQKFMPRRSGSAWSESNKARVEKVIAEGRMTDAGLVLVNAAKSSGEWAKTRRRPTLPDGTFPDELRDALDSSPAAAKAFQMLAPTYQKQYVMWIATAKRAETRKRRTREAIEKLSRGERLGLK